MTIKTKIALLTGALAFAPFLLLAQMEDLGQKRQMIKDEMQQKRQELQKQAQDTRADVRMDIKEKRDEMKDKMRIMAEEAKKKREAVREDIQKKREEFRENAKTRREELKKKLGERRAEKIEQFFKKMVEKFEHAIDRLDKFAERIEERLNKASSAGKNVDAAKAKLAIARDKITAAENALIGAKAKYEEAVKAADFKVAFKNVHDLVKSLAAKVREAHAALVDVVTTLKGLELGGGRATTTPASQ